MVTNRFLLFAIFLLLKIETSNSKSLGKLKISSHSSSSSHKIGVTNPAVEVTNLMGKLNKAASIEHVSAPKGSQLKKDRVHKNGEKRHDGHSSFEFTMTKSCHKDCTKNGNCNEVTGECECPIHRTGAACEHSAMPACQSSPGIFSPCHSADKGYAPTCECARECDIAGAAHHTRTCLLRRDLLPSLNLSGVEEELTGSSSHQNNQNPPLPTHTLHDGVPRILVRFVPQFLPYGFKYRKFYPPSNPPKPQPINGPHEPALYNYGKRVDESESEDPGLSEDPTESREDRRVSKEGDREHHIHHYPLEGSQSHNSEEYSVPEISPKEKRRQIGDVVKNLRWQVVPSGNCENHCHNRGLCVRKHQGGSSSFSSSSSPPQCVCWEGWEDTKGGKACSLIPLDSGLCLGNCSGRGRCLSPQGGFCHCDPGSWGVACEFTSSPSPSSSSSSPSPKETSASGSILTSTSPLVFVYPLPLVMTAGILSDMPRSIMAGYCFHRVHPTTAWGNEYEGEVWLHERLLLSRSHRTQDPNKADFFYVPIWDACADVSPGMLNNPKAKTRAQVLLNYIKATWPFWDRKQGADHIVFWTNDDGGCATREYTEFREKAIVLSYWGLTRPPPGLPVACHTPGKDIVLPPALFNRIGRTQEAILQKFNSLGNDIHRPRTNTLFFCGSSGLATVRNGVLPRLGTGYSFGVRQRVFKWFNNTPGFVLEEKWQGPISEKHYFSSTFCLAPSGIGWGIRLYLAIFWGCIPVIIQPQVSQVFEEFLPFSKFSITVDGDDIEQLPSILGNVSKQNIAQMQYELECVRPKILWSSIFGSYYGEDGSEDAFSTLLTVLARRIENKSGNQDQLSLHSSKCSIERRSAPPGGSFDTQKRSSLCAYPCEPEPTMLFN